MSDNYFNILLYTSTSFCFVIFLLYASIFLVRKSLLSTCCPVPHMLVLCQFTLSLKFLITYSALEFLPTKNVKFHNFT